MNSGEGLDPECDSGYRWSEENEVCVQKGMQDSEIVIDDDMKVMEDATCPEGNQWSFEDEKCVPIEGVVEEEGMTDEAELTDPVELVCPIGYEKDENMEKCVKQCQDGQIKIEGECKWRRCVKRGGCPLGTKAGRNMETF